MTIYGPQNPHPLSKMTTELVWEGKYDEFGNRRELHASGLAMPLQKIETIDEPRSRAEAQGSLFDEQKAHRDDFRNRLIWGDNKLIAASLLQEFQGAVRLIYIDPPFDIGTDFNFRVPIGNGNATEKQQSLLEMVAYRDTWGRGKDSYLQMIYERISTFRDLLTEDGSIYLHCDYGMNSYIRAVMDDVFGLDNFRNEIVWKRTGARSGSSTYNHIHDTILFYTKSSKYLFETQHTDYTDDYKQNYFRNKDDEGRPYQLVTLTAPGTRTGASGAPWKGVDPTSVGRHWAVPRFLRYLLSDSETQDIQKALDELEAADRIIWPRKKGGTPRLKQYIDEMPGVELQSLWLDIPPVSSQSHERTDYETQKPASLLERIIMSSSDEGDIVADFFCGSGTTLAAAERLGRRWIGADLGRFAVHTTRKRLIGIQRVLHQSGQPYRSFDVYNLGRYERQWWQQEALKGAEGEHRAVVLNFFRAEFLSHAPSPLIHGRKGGAFVHVDGIDSIFMRQEAAQVARAVKGAGGREVHCLAWDFEMDLRQAVAGIEADLNIKVRLHRIPREIMEKNRTEVPPFFEMALLEAEPVWKRVDKEQTVDIKLTNFLPSLTEVPAKELEALQDHAVESGFDFIDFWAVDFDWAPDRPFNHHWQDYRTRRNRNLKTVSDAGFVYHHPGHHTTCIKVVDVFGCDTSITVETET